MSKTCTKCNKEHPLGSFYCGSGRDGKSSWCKQCHKAYSADHKDRRAAYMREYSNRNRAKLKAYKKQYHLDNKAKHNQRSSDDYWANRTPCIPMSTEAKAAYKHAWYQANKEVVIARSKVGKAKRRSRLNELTVHFTAAEWRTLCDLCDNACVCCGATGGLSVDHIVPLSEGGDNSIVNIQPLCLHCNLVKATKTIDYLGQG